jgi:phosphoribosyl 1,2-cyclic phosphodiesterase
MNLHILGSNSFGNCYILEAADGALILEAGIRMPEVKKALRWNMGRVTGAVVSHQHNDHAGYVREMVASGVTVLALPEVFRSHGIEGAPFTHPVIAGHGYRLGSYRILVLPVKHDVPCAGFVISHPEMGRLLFVTDTVAFDYIVPRLNTVMIEANYADDIVDENIALGRMHAAMRPRLLNSHMELEQTKAILAAHDLSKVNNIVLIHLSDGNSDEARFVSEVQRLTGRPTCAARPGMNVDISLKPY